MPSQWPPLQAELKAKLREKQLAVAELAATVGAMQSQIAALGDGIHQVRRSSTTPSCSSRGYAPPPPLQPSSGAHVAPARAAPPPQRAPPKPAAAPPQHESPQKLQRRRPGGHERFVGISPLLPLPQAQPPAPEAVTSRKESPGEAARRFEETNRRLQASLATMSQGAALRSL